MLYRHAGNDLKFMRTFLGLLSTHLIDRFVEILDDVKLTALAGEFYTKRGSLGRTGNQPHCRIYKAKCQCSNFDKFDSWGNFTRQGSIAEIFRCARPKKSFSSISQIIATLLVSLCINFSFTSA